MKAAVAPLLIPSIALKLPVR